MRYNSDNIKQSMKKKRTIFLFRRGYWIALGLCLIISFLNGFKYTVFLKDHPTLLDIKKGILSTAFLFVLSGTISIFVVRWYYKLKDTTPGRVWGNK